MSVLFITVIVLQFGWLVFVLVGCVMDSKDPWLSLCEQMKLTARNIRHEKYQNFPLYLNFPNFWNFG